MDEQGYVDYMKQEGWVWKTTSLEESPSVGRIPYCWLEEFPYLVQRTASPLSKHGTVSVCADNVMTTSSDAGLSHLQIPAWNRISLKSVSSVRLLLPLSKHGTVAPFIFTW